MLSLLLLPTCISAKGNDQSIQDVTQSYARQHDFQGTVLVARDGAPIYQESFGLANRPFAVKNTPDTRYRVASITKAFTTVIVLQLVEAGKLDLKQNIKAYLPDFDGEGAETISLHDLLHHTSGLPNPDHATRTYEESLQKGLPQYETLQQPSAFVKRFCTGKLTHPVGAAFDYNNCDFIVLGEIISRVTGQSYEEILEQKILKPLHMDNSGIAHQAAIIPRLANTYFSPGPNQPWRNDLAMYSTENLSAAGAMYSTAGDLLLFADALFSGRLLQRASVEEMMTPGLENYGDGVWVRQYEIAGRKRQAMERYGTSAGANVLLTVFPQDKVSIILLGNTNGIDLGQFRLAIARACIK
jgi:CubicO group peptidase (beta-lactamase class C family)